MKKKIALITGITGQDGAYLAEFLLSKNYEVHGIKRRSSSFNTARIDHLYKDKHKEDVNFFLHYGDLTDSLSVNSLINLIKPDEIYNLAAQSHVAVSFKIPNYTANVDAIGCLNILEAIKSSGMIKKIKFYQAGTSEMFGKVLEVPQSEQTPFHPRSPYGCAKVMAFEITRNYRESYNMFACTGILFNHESPRRGLEFVTRKVTMMAARIKHGFDECLHIGNVDAKRDWGFAGDYVEMQWKMLQQDKPDDYVIATGRTHSIRDMISLSFSLIGLNLTWSGEGVDTIATDQNGVVRVRTNPKFFRPAEVDLLIGDPAYAKEKLGWETKTTFEQLIQMMVESDLAIVQEAVDGGYAPPTPPE